MSALLAIVGGILGHSVSRGDASPSFMIKSADEDSYMARHLLKLYKQKDPATVAKYGHGIFPIARVKDWIAEELRGAGNRKYIGDHTPGYVYRASPGSFTAATGIGASQGVSVRNPDALWVGANFATGRKYWDKHDALRRLKIPSYMGGLVTTERGNPLDTGHRRVDAHTYNPRTWTQFLQEPPTAAHAETVLSRRQIDAHIARNPQSLEVLHRWTSPDKVAVLGPRGAVWSNVPNIPSNYQKHPELRPAKSSVGFSRPAPTWTYQTAPAVNPVSSGAGRGVQQARRFGRKAALPGIAGALAAAGGYAWSKWD